MEFSAHSSNLRKEWSAASPLSKGLIISTLFLVLVAYLPTLQFDYGFKDQWRAFVYSPLEETPHIRFNSCINHRISFYIRSGRPLVSVLGECLEHAAVGKIEDFAYLRPIALSIVIITAFYLGRIITPLVGSWAAGTATASLFLFSPGYAYMYFLGVAAMSNLLCPLIGLWSFSILNKWIDNYLNNQTISLKGLLPSVFLFLIACMIYPIWAFIVISLALAFLGLDRTYTFNQKLKRFAITLALYFFTSILYLIFIKFLIAINFGGSGTVDMGDGMYEISPILNPSELNQRFLLAVKYFMGLPFLNIFSGKWWAIFTPTIFSIFLAKEISVYLGKNNFFYLILYFVGAFLFTSFLLAGALAPFIFSQMNPPSERFFIPWYFFTCVAIVASVWRLTGNLLKINANKFGLIIIIIALLPASFVQNKRSFLEVTISGMEIDFIRSKLWKWLDFEGYKNARYLIAIHSQSKRPAYIDNLLENTHSDSSLLEISGDATHYYQMITAMLRERSDHPIGRSLKMENCGFSPACANDYLKSNPGGVVFIAATNDKPIETDFKEEIFTINLYEITKGEFEPIFKHVDKSKIPATEKPEIFATSYMKKYGPHSLLSWSQPGWHAASPPDYPQSITINFIKPREIKTIGFLPQDNHLSRAPKIVEIESSENGTSWKTLTSEDNTCKPNEANGWHNLKLSQPFTTQFIKINILSNCGDPSFLTLRGLRFN